MVGMNPYFMITAQPVIHFEEIWQLAEAVAYSVDVWLFYYFVGGIVDDSRP